MEGLKGSWCSGITPCQHAGGPGFKPQRVHIALYAIEMVRGYLECAASSGHIQANESVDSEDRTHDLRIMGPTRCQLRYIHLSLISSAHMAPKHTRITT